MDLYKITYNDNGNKTYTYVYAELIEDAIHALKKYNEVAYNNMTQMEVLPEFFDNILVQDD